MEQERIDNSATSTVVTNTTTASAPMEGTAAQTPTYKKDALDEKIVRNFPGKIVRKDLTALMKRGAGIPTFVLEYLLGMYCATDDPEALEAGLARIRKILAENYVRTEESEVIKSRIRELGQYTIIDKVGAYLDERRDLYVAQLANLAIEPFIMPDEYVRKYTKMLTGGIWCIARIQYLRPEDAAEDPLADVFGEVLQRLSPSRSPARRGQRTHHSISSISRPSKCRTSM